MGADDGGLADNNTGAVVNEKVGTDLRAGMNVDTGHGMSVLCHHPGQHGDIQAVQLVGDSEYADGLKGGIGQHDLLPAGGGGVALVSRLHIGIQHFSDSREPSQQCVCRVLR